MSSEEDVNENNLTINLNNHHCSECRMAFYLYDVVVYQVGNNAATYPLVPLELLHLRCVGASELPEESNE